MSAKVLKSTFVIGLMTLISRISGLVRDNIFAQILGSQMVADVFFVAFRIPNFSRACLAKGHSRQLSYRYSPTMMSTTAQRTGDVSWRWSPVA